MKKRIISGFASVIIGAALLTGCGSTDVSVDKEIVESVEDAESVDDVELEEVLDELASGEISSDEVTIEEMVLLDEMNIKITATGFENSWMGPELKLLIENNGDKNVTIQARNESLNGYMVTSMLSEDVAAGKKANTSLTFITTGWEELDALPIANMEFAFCIFDTESWDTYLDSDIITIETSAAGTVDYVMDDSGTVFYDADGIKIVAKGLSENDSIWGPGLILYIENNTDQNFTVQARDTSVNGFMMDGSLSQNVASGKKAITSLTFFETDMESNGVTEISEIETAFVAFDSESWEDLAYTDAMVLNF